MKTLIHHYTIDPEQNKILIPLQQNRLQDLTLSEITLILDTATNTYIYLPINPTLGGSLTLVNGTYELTLSKDISGLDQSTELQIFCFLIPKEQRYPRVTRYNKQIHTDVLGVRVDFDIDIHAALIYQYQSGDNVMSLDYGGQCIQVFKAKEKDLHGYYPVLSATYTALEQDVDLFTAYADTPALIAVHVPSSAKLNVTLIEGVEAHGGAGKCMAFDTTKFSEDHYIRRTFSVAEDWSMYQSLNFYHKSSTLGEGSFMSIRIADTSANVAYRVIPVGVLLDWHKHILLFDDLILESNPLDLSSIDYFEFTVYIHQSNVTDYIDTITLEPISDPANAKAELVYFGAAEPAETDPLPAALTFDDGLTFLDHEISSYPATTTYDIMYGHAHYSNGGGTEMIVGHYYGLVLTNTVDGSILHVHGNDTKLYTEGGLFPVAAGILGIDTNKSQAFSIISHVGGYVESVRLTFNDNPGRGSIVWFNHVNTTTGEHINPPVTLTLLDNQTDVFFNFSKDTMYISRDLGLLVYFQSVAETNATEVDIHTVGRY